MDNKKPRLAVISGGRDDLEREILQGLIAPCPSSPELREKIERLEKLGKLAEVTPSSGPPQPIEK